MNKFVKCCFFLSLLLTSILFTSCFTVYKQKEKTATSLEKVESSALLIEGTRQKVTGNFSSAAVYYNMAISKNPHNCAAHFELSKIYLNQEAYEEALYHAEKAVEIDSGNLYYNMLLAEMFSITNQFNKALLLQKQLVEQNPRNSLLYFSYAETLYYLQKYEEAIEVFNKMERNLGFSEDIAIERQNLYLEMDRIDKAIEEVQMLIDLHPDDLRYLGYLGSLYQTVGDKQKAFETYERMLEVSPGDAYPLLLMADYYQQQEKYEEAFEYIKKAFLSPDLEVASKERIMFTFFYMSENDSTLLEQAYILCDIFIDTHPEKPEPYYILGDFLFRDEKFKKAREAYSKAKEIYPGNLVVWEQMLYIDSELSDYESMYKTATESLEYFFEYPILYYYQAISAYHVESYETVIDAMSQAVILVMSDDEIVSDFYTLMADAYNKLKKYDKADEKYQAALQLKPDNAYALNNYSYSLSVRKERLEEAKQMSKLSNELVPGNSAFQDTYGWIMYQMGNYNEALIWLERALKNMEEDRPVILEHYGDVLYKLGDSDKAVRYWEKAAEAGEGSEFLKKKIKDQTLYE